MNIKQFIGIILLVAACFFGYTGINTYAESSSDVELLGLEIEADDNLGERKGIMQLTFAILLFGGGIYTLNRS